MPHDAETIRRAADAVKRVHDIDQTIRRIGQKAEGNLTEWGKSARDIFGQNLLSQMTHEHIGDLVFCAVVNGLLELRGQCVEEHKGVVDFPGAPCPRQTPTN
jgi:hypothetical protein